MQIPPGDTLRHGALVRVRRQPWRIADVRAFDRCHLVTLVGAGAANWTRVRRILTPFDRVEPIAVDGRLRRVSGRTWRRRCRALLAGDTHPADLRTAASARIDLLPHQLEPALAVVAGRGSRVLLADEVGLGKTIEAGLILSELRARGAADRVLILTPAGLRDQWAGELAARFRIDAAVLDVGAIRRLAAALPSGVNPWATVPVAIASIDLAKRSEVLPAIAACRWDVLVVDEAHAVAGDSDRHLAVAELAARAPFVVLATATPHSGDRAAFAALTRLGAHDDRLLVFRRTRRDVRADCRRRIHRLRVRPSAAERRVHRLLARFGVVARSDLGDARDVQLALFVLYKRALSSAWSLRQSIARRLADMQPDASAGAGQLALPLDRSAGEIDEDDATPSWPEALTLHNPGRERDLLQALAVAADRAVSSESKLSALVRLLGRIDEPAIVFTEFRDTLQHVADVLRRPVALLHGGMSREARRAALEEFTGGRRSILLATDAAGVGLNLHAACRIVINLELPWNPMRLEQRIGRVDRIGQQRTVHAFHLIARDTIETQIFDRLCARIASAQADVGAPDPLGIFSSDGDPASAAAHAVPSDVTTVDVADAAIDAARTATLRRMLSPSPSTGVVEIGDREPWLTNATNRTTRQRLGARLVILAGAQIDDRAGRTVASKTVPIAVSLANGTRLGSRAVAAIVDAATSEIRRTVEQTTASWRLDAVRTHLAFIEVRLARERAVAAMTPAGPAVPVQPGLFDRRAEHDAAARRVRAADAESQTAAVVSALEAARLIVERPPELRLVLSP